MQGWVKLHRKFASWKYSSSPKHVTVWMHLLTQAAHQENSFYFNDRLVSLKPGQILIGRKAFSEALGISEQNLRTVLNHFQSDGQINQQKTTKYTIISICNWDEHQVTNQELTNKSPTSNQQLTTYKNDKNENNEKKIKELEKSTSLKTEIAQNVYLTEQQHASLIAKFGLEGTLDRVTALSLWITAKGKLKEVKCAYSTILNWERREKKNPTQFPVAILKSDGSIQGEINFNTLPTQIKREILNENRLNAASAGIEERQKQRMEKKYDNGITNEKGIKELVFNLSKRTSF